MLDLDDLSCTDTLNCKIEVDKKKTYRQEGATTDKSNITKANDRMEGNPDSSMYIVKEIVMWSTTNGSDVERG